VYQVKDHGISYSTYCLHQLLFILHSLKVAADSHDTIDTAAHYANAIIHCLY